MLEDGLLGKYLILNLKEVITEYSYTFIQIERVLVRILTLMLLVANLANTQ